MTAPIAPPPAETALDVLRFWWSHGVETWFGRNAAFDAEVVRVLLPAHRRAVAGALADWEETADGSLALILLLDQVPRNAFRGTADAFASDALALAAARRALARGFPDAYPPVARTFFFLPFEHAEDMEAQSLGCDLFRGLGDKELYFYALVHMDAIRRFGRFPHRNAVLGRVSTAEEEAYLASGGFSA